MNTVKSHIPLLVVLVLVSSLTAYVVAQSGDAKVAPQVVSAADVKWGALNPARGKNGPRAGNLWGDRTGEGTSGFLVKFADGFSSPPHIHNVTYRGVVISGLIHNDDPEAEEMWMPPGSFWTQPAGEVHITAAKGEDVVAYIEIQQGPYLVLPEDEAFDRGERPVNVDTSNLVWLNVSSSTWIVPSDEEGSVNEAEIAYLWGSPQAAEPSGTLVKLPAGFTGRLRSKGTAIDAVVITGKPKYRLSGEGGIDSLESGNYFGSAGAATHEMSCDPEDETLIYVRTEGAFEVISGEPGK